MIFQFVVNVLVGGYVYVFEVYEDVVDCCYGGEVSDVFDVG